MAASHGGPLIVPVTVRWSDLDAYGHVNNAAVVTLLEEARVAALWRTGRPGEAPSNAVPGGPDAPVRTFVVRQEIEHRTPLGYPAGPLPVRLWFARVGAADLVVAYEVPAGPEPDAPVAVIATTTLAVVDAVTSRPTRIGPDLRAVWEPYLAPAPRFRHRHA